MDWTLLLYPLFALAVFGIVKQQAGNIVATIAVVALVAGFGYWKLAPSTESALTEQTARQAEDPCSDTQYNRILARRMAEDFVRKDLASPSSAKFGGYDETVVWVQDDCRFKVNSHVDAQNAFGATVRQNYRAIVQHNQSTDSWSLVEIDLYN